MVMIVIVLTVIVSWATQTLANPAPDDWNKLEISPKALCSMPYANYRIPIYEHSRNRFNSTIIKERKYYFAPVAMLDHTTVRSMFNNVTKTAEMKFEVLMWNEDIQESVKRHLTHLDIRVESVQVLVLPIETLILSSTIESAGHAPNKSWLAYNSKKHVELSIVCAKLGDCDRLAAEMRSNPAQFSHLRMMYAVSSVTTKKSETVIRIENVVTGEMMTQLLQKFPNSTEVLLTAEDKKTLMKETANNVLKETLEDSMEVFSPNTEDHIYKLLNSMLASSVATIAKGSEDMWESVFWNDDNYRPDKVSKQLNDMYKKLDTETRKAKSNEFSESDKISVGAHVAGSISEIELATIGGSFDIEASMRNDSMSDEMNKLLGANKKYVEWNGEKFAPKPLELYRFNVAKLRDGQSLRDHKVRMEYVKALLVSPINLKPSSKSSVRENQRDIEAFLFNLRHDLDGMIRRVSTHINETDDAIGKLQHILTPKDNFKYVGASENELHLKKQLTELQNRVDVKKDVFFDAHRTLNYNKTNSIIEYQSQLVNVGAAINVNTGVFTAPRKGIYQFNFQGLLARSSRNRATVSIRKNGNFVVASAAIASDSVDKQFVSATVTLPLIAKDTMTTFLEEGTLLDGDNQKFTHFSGTLLRES